MNRSRNTGRPWNCHRSAQCSGKPGIPSTRIAINQYKTHSDKIKIPPPKKRDSLWGGGSKGDAIVGHERMRILFIAAKTHTIEPYGIMCLSPHLKADGHTVRLNEAEDPALATKVAVQATRHRLQRVFRS